MNAVGKLGSYISRSVYIVSGPFQRLGGAVDIIVVEQPDGSFKSSPWYVRFGKFQGVLKANDKIVSVIVNGVEADFRMNLDQKGEAHFTREVDFEDGDSSVSPLSFSGEDTDGIRSPMKSKSCNFDAHRSDTVTQIDGGRILSRTNSRRSRILGFVMGRRSAKESSFLEGKNDSGFMMKESLESAEIAADLLELKWSKSLVSSRHKTEEISVRRNGLKELFTGVQNNRDSDDSVNSSPLQQDDSFTYEKDHSSCSIPPTESTEFAKETGMTFSCLVSTYVPGKSPVESNDNSVLQMLHENEKTTSNDDKTGESMSPLDTADYPVLSCLGLSESSEVLFFGEPDDIKGINEGQENEKQCKLVVLQIESEENNGSSIAESPVDIDINLKTVSSDDLNIHERSGFQVEQVFRTAISLPNISEHDSNLSNFGVSPVSDHAFSEHTRLQDDVFKDSNPDAQHVSITDEIDNESEIPKLKGAKKYIRTTTPTTEELKSLKLKEGTNTVVFTFSTPMSGNQQVEARIHLWKWDSRIVISDVDGTITRSDVLGQVMPLVGVDWSHTGVAHLFSAIKENGYHVLFLSARAISQSYSTRQFLCNLKQDGKALPEGPVVISPDGLFPSLYREVVRRAPHEFKISCLEAIKALFPPDRNPFYAGFGNRDTDEISYLKVGIPKGKIFIINPKGEIVVNRRVDRNSYTSLHSLVDDMFPLMSSSEQEDFNSWNYWKLPLPCTDI